MLKEKYISESLLSEEPKKKLALKILDGTIEPRHFNKNKVDGYILSIVDSIEGSGMLPEDKAKLDALPTATELQSALNAKANSSNVYTKSEINNLLDNLIGEYYAS